MVFFCSSRKDEISFDSQNGGAFSSILTDLLSQENLPDYYGDRRLQHISLAELYQPLKTYVEEHHYEINPQLFIGETLPKFGLVRNPNYRPISCSFSRSFKKTLEIFYNGGHPRGLTTDELRLEGCTAQTTYSKLGYLPAWGLIDKSERGIGRLTGRGIDFVEGRITIPYKIEKNQETDKYVAADGTREIHFNDVD